MKVQSSRTTWLLFLLAAAIAGLIATWRFAERASEPDRAPPARSSGVVDVELVE